MLCAYACQSQYTEELNKLYYNADYTGVTNLLVDDDLLAPEDFFIIANAFHKLEDFEMAHYYYEMAESQSYELPHYFLNRAICEISVGDVENAEKHLFIYEDQYGKRPIIYYNYAVIDYEMLEYKTAKESVEIALESDPDYMEAWFLLGAINMEMDKYDKAADCFQNALNLSPDHPEAKLYLAVALIYNKSYEDALLLLGELEITELSLLPEINYYTAEAHFMMHNQDLACEKWEKAASLGDDFAAKALKTICEKGKVERHKTRKMDRITL